MKLSSYIHGICLKLSLLLAAGNLLPGCDSLIYDGEGDCKVTYRVRFRYDRNLKFADAFASEVESVTLCLFDEQGRIVWRKTERGEALKAEGYAMEVDGVPGTYDLVAWCGSTDKNSFAIPDGPARKQEWTATLNRDHASGGAFVSEDLDRLYHGYLPAQLFAKAEEGVFTYTMPLTKDTNNVRVVLQQLSGEAMDKDRFIFRITAENGRMDWDNGLLPDELVSYYAWYQQSGTAGVDVPDVPGTVTSLSAVVAELTTARLTVRDRTRTAGDDFPDERRMFLEVFDKETQRMIVRVPLVDYALLVKGENRRDMDDQEFLDRMDEYNLVFVLDANMRWLSMDVNIHSWKLVFHNKEI